MIPSLVSARARRTPDATAVIDASGPTTYRDLDARARRLAARLVAAGTARDDIVAIHSERSVALVAGVVGILYAGAAFLPLDGASPPQRLEAMLADAGEPLVVAPEDVAGGLPGRTLTLDDLPAGTLAELPDRHADDLAYVMFTSGSTGRPKGVLSTHGGLLNRLVWMNDVFALSSHDRVLHKTPIGFDVSVWELLWPLAFGAPLVLARPGGHWDLDYLVDAITGAQITIVHFVPTLLRRFLRAPGVERCTSLRAIICSGEALSAQLRDDCLATLPAELHNLYGPTEASIDVTHWHCRRGDRRSSVPIGHPISNTSVHVLDESLRPVPDGEPGELCIAGAGLARGYLGPPALTSDRFATIRLAGCGEQRVYRSGDLGRRGADGALEYLGRLDRQIKLGGVRIEPAEIEAALEAQPAVRASAVRLRDGQLVAYVEGDVRDGAAELRGALADRLPAAMIPSAIVAVSELPVTANGKLDDDALAAAPAAAPAPATRPVSAGTLEDLITGVWCELLLVDDIVPSAQFFEVGGHSLMLVELHRRLEDLLQRRFPPAELVRHTTPAEQARYLATLDAPA